MKTAIENDPEFFIPYNLLGIRWLNATNQELPEADITGVIKEFALAYPTTPQVYDMGLFMNHFVNKDYSEVVKNGKMLVKLSPYNGGVNNLLGYANMADGDMKATKFSFKNYIKAFPNEANPYYSIGEYYMAAKDYKKSSKNYNKASESGMESSKESLIRLEGRWNN